MANDGSISVQDKTVGRKEGLQYHVSFHKHNGVVGGQYQYHPYAPGDNSVYLIFVLDQDYKKSDFQGSVEDFLSLANKSTLRGCYMFREVDLISTRHIATATQPGKMSLHLPVPNADGTFNANKTDANRTHNMQPYYYHKTNFKALIGAIM